MNAIRAAGFVGLGNMGFQMAGHVARAGFALTVYDIAPGLAERFAAEHGGAAAADLADLAGCDAIITMLPTGAAVREVVEALAPAMAAGSVVIDMSTSNPVDSRETARLLAARGIGMIDAPVAGGVVFAKDATLSVTAGGDAALLGRCRLLLEAMARDIFHCGPLGAGHAMKALNNFVNASALLTAFEALAIGRRFGLDDDVMLKAMTAAATGRNNPIEKKLAPFIADPAYETGMALALLAKDVGIAADTATSLDAFAPIAEQCAALWRKAAKAYGGDADQIAVGRLWLEHSGR